MINNNDKNNDNNYINNNKNNDDDNDVTTSGSQSPTIVRTAPVDTIASTTTGSSLSSALSSQPTILLQRRLTTILASRRKSTKTVGPNRITINNNNNNSSSIYDDVDNDTEIQEGAEHREELIEKLIGDVVVATTVSLGIAPFLTVIDQAVVQRISANNNTATKGPTSFLAMTGIIITNILKNPIQYIRSPTFLWMWLTYASTYSAANTLRTLTTDYDQHQYYRRCRNTTNTTKSNNYTTATPSSSLPTAQSCSTNATTTTTKFSLIDGASSSSGIAKTTATTTPTTTNTKVTLSSASSSILFIGTTIVNSTVSMLKDRAYAKLYGATSTASGAIQQGVPKLSYAVWIGRDLTVIGSSFIVPNYVSQILHEQGNIPTSQSMKIAQLLSPVVAQIVATPFHMIGFDYYNRPNIILEGTNGSMKDHVIERLRCMRMGYMEVLMARMVRVIPGYGIGGVYNTSLRNQWNNFVHHDHHHDHHDYHTLFYGIFHHHNHHHHNQHTTPEDNTSSPTPINNNNSNNSMIASSCSELSSSSSSLPSTSSSLSR